MDRDMQQRIVAALEGIERHLRVIAGSPRTEVGKRARDAGLRAAKAEPRIVAVPYVPGEGCDCPSPWGGVVRTNPDCMEHRSEAHP